MNKQNKKGFFNPRMIIVIIAVALVLYFGAFSAYIATDDTQYGAFRQQAEWFSCSGYKLNLEQGLTLMREGQCQAGYDFFANELNGKLPSSSDAWVVACKNEGYALRNVLNNYYCSGGQIPDDTIEVNPDVKNELAQEIQIEAETIQVKNEVIQDIQEQQINPVVQHLSLVEKINLWITNLFSKFFGGNK